MRFFYIQRTQITVSYTHLREKAGAKYDESLRDQSKERVSALFDKERANDPRYKSLPKYMQEYWYKHEAYTYVLLDSPERKAEIEREFPVMAEKYKMCIRDRTRILMVIQKRLLKKER